MSRAGHFSRNAENADIADIAKRRTPNAKREAYSCPTNQRRYLVYFSPLTNHLSPFRHGIREEFPATV
jgi:hypothetical protein